MNPQYHFRLLVHIFVLVLKLYYIREWQPLASELFHIWNVSDLNKALIIFQPLYIWRRLLYTVGTENLKSDWLNGAKSPIQTLHFKRKATQKNVPDLRLDRCKCLYSLLPSGNSVNIWFVAVLKFLFDVYGN